MSTQLYDPRTNFWSFMTDWLQLEDEVDHQYLKSIGWATEKTLVLSFLEFFIKYVVKKVPTYKYEIGPDLYT